MKITIKIIATLAIAFVLFTLFGVDLTFKKMAKEYDNQNLALNIVNEIIVNGCRNEGLVTKCFKVTPDECISVQKDSITACSENKDLKTTDKAQLSNTVAAMSSCAFEGFLGKYLNNLQKELLECQSPDMSKIFEIEKIISKFSS